ncbi:MAG: hypothetical protein U1E76_16820 [Planctomycetota bacterium]
MSFNRRTIAWSVLVAGSVAAGPLVAQSTKRASVNNGGIEGNARSLLPSLDRSGRYVAFQSDASNLDFGDVNMASDVFVRDRAIGVTDLVSVNNGGAQGTGASDSPHLSGLGQYVVFRSDAPNFWPGDINGLGDIILRDIPGALTEPISLDFGGGPANGASYDPFVTTNGRWVAFTSSASDLVPGDMNGLDDCFVRDRMFAVTECLSVNGAGVVNANGASGAPSLSADGRYAVFHSDASNLVPGDMNAVRDVFMRDRLAGVTVRISLGPGGVEANGASSNPWISEDGRYVTYQSDATNLVAVDVNAATDVFVFDRLAVTTVMASVSTAGVQGIGNSLNPVINSDGTRVAFTSEADNLSPQDTNLVADAHVRDLWLGVTHRASLSELSLQSAGASDGATISGNGRVIAFSNAEPDLVGADTNLVDDVFVRDEVTASATLYGAGFPGTFGIPFLGMQNTPVMGTIGDIEIGNSRGVPTLVVMFLGLATASLPTPWGGDLLVQPSIVLPAILPAGIFTLGLNIPHEEKLEGLAVYMQVLELDPGAAAGVSFTQGLGMLLGW